MRVLLGLLLLLLATSCVRLEDKGWNPEGAIAFHEDVADCVEGEGYAYLGGNAYEPAILASGRPDVVAYNDCYELTLTMPAHQNLGYLPPLVELQGLRDEGFALWKCVEDEGYARQLGIRLSSEGGYPLAPAPVEFGVGESEDDVRRFYETAATCGDVPLDVFRNPFGEFDPGSLDCLRHEHDGDPHQHNCVRVEDYPAVTG